METQLFESIKNNNIEMIRSLLENGIHDFNTRGYFGRTPLYFAVWINNIGVVKLLLKYGAQASINIPDNDGWTPLCQAVWDGNIKMVKLLLKYGAHDSINTPTNWESTPLYQAVGNNNIEMVKLLLENGAQPSINTPNVEGRTPLYKAVEYNNIEMVKLLLYNGAHATINSNIHGFTAHITPEVQEILYNPDKYRMTFTPENFHLLSNKTKNSINILLLIRSFGNESFSRLPNELLFELFNFLRDN